MWEAEAAYVHLCGDHNQLLHNHRFHPLKHLRFLKEEWLTGLSEVTSNQVDDADFLPLNLIKYKFCVWFKFLVGSQLCAL